MTDLIEFLLVIIVILATKPELTVPLFATILLFLTLPIIRWPEDEPKKSQPEDST